MSYIQRERELVKEVVLAQLLLLVFAAVAMQPIQSMDSHRFYLWSKCSYITHSYTCKQLYTCRSTNKFLSAEKGGFVSTLQLFTY